MPRTGATVSVVRSYANPQEALRALDDNRGHDVQVLARRDDSDPVALTLEIYTRQQQQQQPSQLTLQAVPFTFSCARKTSWSALKQLRAGVLGAVATVETHSMSATAPRRRTCEQCQRIAAYAARCFEQPAAFNRAWNGSMVLNAKRVALVINTLLRLASCEHTSGDNASSSECVAANKSDECSEAADTCCARAVVAVLAAFLVPDLAKGKTE